MWISWDGLNEIKPFLKDFGFYDDSPLLGVVGFGEGNLESCIMPALESSNGKLRPIQVFLSEG